MAPGQTQRRSGRGGGHHPTKIHAASNQRLPVSKSNLEHPPTVSGVQSCNRKLPKRKYHETNSSGLTDYKGSASSSTHTSSDESIPSMPAATSSQQSDNLWQFRAQSTSSEIETDAVCVTNAGPHQNYSWPNPCTLSDDSDPKSIMASSKNGEHSTDSAPSLSENERKLIVVTAYVNNMSPENVTECMLILKRSGVAVTRESLFDECEKRKSYFSSRADQNCDAQKFPQQNLSNGTKGMAPSALNHHSGSAARKTQASGQVPAAHVGASSSQHQNSSSLGNAASAEDQVDGLCQSNLPNNQGSTEKTSNPAAVYQSKVNNVSSHSSATAVDSSMASPVVPPRAKPSEIVSKRLADLEKNVLSRKAADSKSQQSVTDEGSQAASNSHSSSETVGDGAAASTGAQNDLNKEPSEPGKNTVVAGARKPLKELDPVQHLATCLKLVRDEYKRLDIARQCGECGAKPRDITFLPCGHVWACRSCAQPLYICPCCKVNIIATVDTFLG